MMRLVSVIVPTHDRPGFLRRALRSIVTQSYAPIELVVVDDASSRPAAPIVEDVVGDRLHATEVLRQETNLGGAGARNAGIDAANGELIAFLDDDDRWLPETVARYVSAFEDAPGGTCLVSVGARNVDGEGRIVRTVRPSFHDDPLVTLATGAGAGSFSRFAVAAEAIEAAGPLDERLPCWQDREWQLRLARHGSFHAVSEVLVERTMGEHDQLTDDHRARRDVAYPILVDRHRETMAERGCEGAFLATTTRSLGFSALQAGRYGEALRWLARSLRWDPTAGQSYLCLGMAVGGPLTRGLGRALARRFSPAR